MTRTLVPTLCALGLASTVVAGPISLMDQIGAADGSDIIVANLFANQYFEAAYAQYDVAVIDDFMNTDGAIAVTVSAVIGGWNGYGGLDAVQGVQVSFYNTMTEAGESLTGYVSMDFDGTPVGDPDWPLAIEGFELLTYEGNWAINGKRQAVALIPVNEYGVNGQTGMVGSTIGDNIAYQANPGGGFGFGPYQPLEANPAVRVIGSPGDPCNAQLPTECTADVSGPSGTPDHVVNVEDLLIVIGTFGDIGDGTSRPQGDCAPLPNGDCIVNVNDVLQVIGSFGADCTPTGACCFGIDGCTADMSEADCTASAGDWFGDGSTCDGCVAGACCQENGDCAITLQNDCTGTAFHADTTCEDAACTAVAGACCLDNVTCLDGMSPADCAAFAGEFMGDGVSCLDSPCGWPGCGDDDTSEGLPCQGDSEPGFYDENGGNNSDPPSFGAIADGETICGFMSTFTCIGCGANGEDVTYRDTDWYLFANGAGGTYTIHAGGDGALLIGIVQLSTNSFVAYGYSEAQDVVVVTTTLGAGDDYAVFVSHDWNGAETPCDQGQNDYTVSLYGDTAPDAACCLGLECIGDLSPLDCNTLGGTYVAAESCDTYNCPEAYMDCDTGIGQSPELTDWWAGTSDTGSGYIRYEDIDAATISSIRVWGLTLFHSGEWTACSDMEMSFDVAAYEDDGTGYPGTMTGEAVGVIADQAPLDVALGGFTLSRFDIPLVTTTPSQWLKVASNGNNCWFLWIASSADGDGGTSLLDTNGTWSTDVRDLSYCITP